VSVINIADYRNPVFDTTYGFTYSDAANASLPAPSVVVDSFLYIATNYYDNYDAIALNISNPMQPVYRGIVGSHWQEKLSIAYQNGYLYVGARIYNISSSPTGDSLVGYMMDRQPVYQIPFGQYIHRLTNRFDVLDFFEYLQVYEPNNKLPEHKNDFFLFPNPSAKYANINLLESKDGNMQIYDIRGQRIEQIDIKRDKSSYTINLSEYPTGLYLITYNYGSERVVKKLVVIGK